MYNKQFFGLKNFQYFPIDYFQDWLQNKERQLERKRKLLMKQQSEKKDQENEKQERRREAKKMWEKWKTEKDELNKQIKSKEKHREAEKQKKIQEEKQTKKKEAEVVQIEIPSHCRSFPICKYGEGSAMGGDRLNADLYYSQIRLSTSRICLKTFFFRLRFNFAFNFRPSYDYYTV